MRGKHAKRAAVRANDELLRQEARIAARRAREEAEAREAAQERERAEAVAAEIAELECRVATSVESEVKALTAEVTQLERDLELLTPQRTHAEKRRRSKRMCRLAALEGKATFDLIAELIGDVDGVSHFVVDDETYGGGGLHDEALRYIQTARRRVHRGGSGVAWR